MKLTGDEQDALAVNCGKCWARPGEDCHRPSGRTCSPHKMRIRRAGRKGLLGGLGRMMRAKGE